MRRSTWLPLLLGGALICVPTGPSRGEPLPDPQWTNEPRFELPVQVEAGDPSVAEVRLYASSDAGKTWTVAHRTKPPVAGFTFAAPADGEYWFCVRTADAAGREEAVDGMQPELRVIVDAAAPQLDVQVQRAPTGELMLRWNCSDRQWNVDSLKITYRTLADPMWHTVPALRTKRHGDPTSGGGEIEWTPPAQAEPAAFRVEVRDAAGNVTIKEVAVEAGGGAPPVHGDPAPTPAPAAAKTEKARDPWKPLWVNSLSFELDYDIGRAAPTAIEQVAVWGTRDDGRTWVQLGVDEDRRSPCAVNVDREGMFGFTIIVTAGGTASAEPPQPGTPPEIRVGVDLHKPQVRLTIAEPDAEGRPCAMKINWQANDEHLSNQAVSLAYSAGPNGPWLPLALGVPNDGGRVCEFDPQGPDAVYLRIEVRDEAGNLGAFSTTTPIPVEKRSRETRFVGSTEGKQPKSTPKWFHVLR